MVPLEDLMSNFGVDDLKDMTLEQATLVLDGLLESKTLSTEEFHALSVATRYLHALRHKKRRRENIFGL